MAKTEISELGKVIKDSINLYMKMFEEPTWIVDPMGLFNKEVKTDE